MITDEMLADGSIEIQYIIEISTTEEGAWAGIDDAYLFWTGDLVDAAVPVIESDLTDATYVATETPEALKVVASVSDGGVLSYQWYVSKTDNVEDAEVIEGAISDSYTPDTSVSGTRYYFQGYHISYRKCRGIKVVSG